MNKGKIMWWLAEQVFFYDFNNKPFKHFNPDYFDINEEEWNKTLLRVEKHHLKLMWGEEE